MNNKELKEKYSNMTLGELKGIYSEKVRVSNYHKEQIRTKAQELANLDFENKYYVDKAKSLMNDISFYKTDIKDDEAELKIIKPILDKKELEGINQEEYERYITNNTDIRILIKAVEDKKQKFIDEGHKVIVGYEKETKKPIEIVLSIHEVDCMYDVMLKETIMILKDRIGNLKEIKRLESNGNRGFDGVFKGEKGSININTVMAGGYNIQKLHFRTLVYTYNY